MLGILVALAAALFVTVPVIFVVFAVFAAVLPGLAVLLAAGIFAGKGILPGIVLGYVLYRIFRKSRMTESAE